ADDFLFSHWSGLLSSRPRPAVFPLAMLPRGIVFPSKCDRKTCRSGHQLAGEQVPCQQILDAKCSHVTIIPLDSYKRVKDSGHSKPRGLKGANLTVLVRSASLILAL